MMQTRIPDNLPLLPLGLDPNHALSRNRLRISPAEEQDDVGRLPYGTGLSAAPKPRLWAGFRPSGFHP